MKMSTERIISKLDKDVQLLILVNPNNPVGNTYTEEEFQELLSRQENWKLQFWWMKHIIIFIRIHLLNML